MVAIEIRVPQLGESVTDATVAKWLKHPGEAVTLDEPVVELETDKVNVEVPAPASGVLAEIVVAEGAQVPVGGILGILGDGLAEGPPPRSTTGPGSAVGDERQPQREGTGIRPDSAVRPATAAREEVLARAGPAVRKLVAEGGFDMARIAPTGPGGRLTKADLLAARAERPEPIPELITPSPIARPAEREMPPSPDAERETRVRMTRLRQRIAERLKAAQNTAAILTTFNEIDMTRTIALRERWRDAFEKKHGVRLGFMSVFVKAAITALKEFPALNAEIDKDEIVYKNYYDIGVAVGTEHGLVVPVVRDADRLSFAEVEKEIAALGRKARDVKLSIDELSGGTFTISNGGIYGSLLSTPILNPPQSGILGMHKIERRPVAVAASGGETVEIRPMMYVALSYDHRLVDGREAVGFLVRIKELVEDPARLLFEI
jgi:2-oxoglutarate dehydrogenase E2 component (dihydrolipoamide succinyltransferase)